MPTTPSSPVRIATVLFALLWLAYSYVHQGHTSPIALSRLDALQARWNHGTWQIDAYHANTPDKALVKGHYYSDKAPGTLLLTAPGFYGAAAVLTGCGIQVDSPRGWQVTSWATSVFGVGLVAALGGVACFFWLTRRVPARAALVTTLAVYLGAAPFPYATMLFSHAAVVGLISLALWALNRSETGVIPNSAIARGAHPPSGAVFRALAENPDGTQASEVSATCLLAPKLDARAHPVTPVGGCGPPPAGGQTRMEAIGGLSLGLALASEYSSGIVIVGLLGYFALGDRWRTWRVSLWMVPMLLLIPAYSWVCFGTPFTIGYAHNENFGHLKTGFVGIQLPDLENGWRLLFGETRGLFYWSPFLLLALPGYAGLLRKDTRWFWAAYLIPVVDTVVLSGNTLEWMGGPCLGPRYLAPLLPLLALAAAFAVERWMWAGLVGAGLSLALTGGGTLLNASLPMARANPLVEELWPRFLAGNLAPNLGRVAGLSGIGSVVPLLLVEGAGWVWLWHSLPKPRRTKSVAGMAAPAVGSASSPTTA